MRERVVGAELDHRVADVVVAVADVDVPRAGTVRGARQRPRKRRMLHLRGEEDGLPFLHVRADAHSEVGIAPRAARRSPEL